MEEQKQCSNCNGPLTKVAIRKGIGKGFEFRDIGICQNCTRQIVPKPFMDEERKPNWKNMIVPDFQTVVVVVIILLLLFAYKKDMSMCQDAIKKPCDFCAATGCYNPITKYSSINTQEIKPIIFGIDDENHTK